MISLLRLIPLSGQRDAILQILQTMIAPTRAKSGSMNCGVYEESDFDRSILYLEQWQSEEDLQRHVQSSLYLRVLTAMDLAKDPPQVSFNKISRTQNVELIEALRK